MSTDKTTHLLTKEVVDKLIRDYGSPLLVFDESVIKTRYKEIEGALDILYPKNKIAYSVKTNYLPALISILKDSGVLSEVVSGFEYWLAKKLGYRDEEIIYNGPDKSKESLEEALMNGAMVNIDSRDEFLALPFKKLKNKKIKIGIRTNTSTRSLSHQRFGFNLENGEIFSFIDEVKKKYPQCVIAGLHIHLNSVIKPSHYEDIAERLSDCAIAIEKKWGDSIQYLDFGGGFLVPGARSMWGILWDVPDIEEYVMGIANVLLKKFPNEKPYLIVEPGRYLIDEAGIFITTVINSKFVESFQDNNKIRHLFANILFKAKKHSDSIQIAAIDSNKTSILKSLSDERHIKLIQTNKSLKNKTYSTYIVGNSCIPPDYLSKKINLPCLNRGDKILFSNAGAYSISRSEQFIPPRPAVILIRENGEIKRIRQKETYEDMISLCQP